jgi:hypothetical protein
MAPPGQGRSFGEEWTDEPFDSPINRDRPGDNSKRFLKSMNFHTILSDLFPDTPFDIPPCYDMMSCTQNLY